jgi:hypothetical protein
MQRAKGGQRNVSKCKMTVGEWAIFNDKLPVIKL